MGIGVQFEKEGINTGIVCVNPFNGKEVQIWITNYVLADYGTGAVIGVPSEKVTSSRSVMA